MENEMNYVTATQARKENTPMTVRELSELLAQQSQDIEVCIRDNSHPKDMDSRELTGLSLGTAPGEDDFVIIEHE